MKSRFISLLPVLAVLVACGPGHSQDNKTFQGTGFGNEPRQVPSSAVGMKTSFAPVVRTVAPAVVNVYAKVRVRENVDPFWQMFGNGVPQSRTEGSLGSGVIVRKDGIVVTNNHVVAGGQTFMVVLNDRREYSAKLLLSDPRSDLAVLKLEAPGETFQTIELNDGRDLEVGDLVLAIGNPFGVGQTVTNGIISALNRSNGEEGNFIQTDAAINPGNSGGALVDMNGKLIGINAQILSRAGQSSGVGFAIPAAMVKRVVDSAAGGATSLKRPWLGAKGDTVTSDIAKSLGMDRPEGVLVSDVYKGSAADQAGLQTGDVILAINGQAVNDAGGLRYQISLLNLNQTAKIEGLRQGKPFSVNVKATPPSDSPPRDERLIKGENPFAGAKVVNLSPAVADEIGVDPFDAPRGVMIYSIESARTYAAGVGLQPGDIVREVNGKVINTSGDLDAVAKQGARSWRISIQRGGRIITAQFS
ncbi:serine protease [Asticcacaulis sp. AC460]|uniref:Do family serine endopeptidase n=1 Tax=Asticcacaulis sp. AC460 TaxID=1282360 RepID=UPI0003C3AECD|nr:Do family serine endopeptidase [Asticcacaulis sp. AC460]ESQ92070.1 serine protease [Asticcacaulis sp. AC460]